jgi:SGNH hydrolase-like domain, acetyltransferase AlgX
MRNVLLVVFGLVMGAALAEGILRTALRLPDPPGSAYLRDPDCAYRLRPEPVATAAESTGDHINAFGFRDREHSIEKPAGTLRILGLGDSFVYGAVPLEMNFLRVAASRLNEVLQGSRDAPDGPAPGPESPRRAESVLMGLGGYSTGNELGVLRSTGLALHPDVVVLCFFVGNDVTGIPVRGEVLFGRLYYVGSATRWRNVLRRSRTYVLGEMFFVTRIKRPLLAWRAGKGERKADSEEPNRRTAVTIETPDPRSAGTIEAGSGWGLRAPPPVGRNAARSLDDDATPDPPLSPLYVDIESRNVPVYARFPGPAVSRSWEEAERQIVAFDTVCRENRLRWILVVIPEELQVDSQVRSALGQALDLDPAAFDFDLPQERLARLTAQRGIRMVDPLPQLRAAHDPHARLYHPNDTHWNEAGNAVAGDVLASAIREMLLHGSR